MTSKILFFTIFCFIFLFVLISIIGFAQMGGGGGAGGVIGGAGGAYSVVGCWDYNTQPGCDNTSDSYQCSWHQSSDTGWGWCEERGCWQYTSSTPCVLANCTWEETYNYCYKKGCWDYNNSADCTGSVAGCRWESSGYCSKPTCWDYKDSTSCESTQDSLTCKWDSSFGSCNGPADKNCGTYSNQISCAAVSGCSWQSGQCNEKGCWDYYNQTICNANNVTGCAWGSQGSSGYCKLNQTQCSDMNKTLCQGSPRCSWQGSEWCQQKSCSNLNTQASCANTTDNLNCVWDSSSYYCKQIDCWSFDNTNSTMCQTNASQLYNLTCTYNNNYCSRTSCYDLNISARCENTTDSLNCRWNSNWNGCEEKGCWNYNDNTNCSDITDGLSCTWKQNAWCEQKWCSYYNISSECTNSTLHSTLNCVWDNSSNYCYEQGCWNLNSNASCLNATDNFTCAWDSTYNYCYEYGCWNYNSTTCTNSTLHPGLVCALDSSNYCNKPGCWNVYDQTGCLNSSDNIDCTWQSSYFCQQQGCSEYINSTNCNNDASCSWYSNTWCSEKGCWSYNNKADCEIHLNDMRCAWDTTYNYCYIYSCSNYNASANCGNATSCRWNSNGNYCEEKGCWNFWDNDTCSNATNSTGVNCTWESYAYCYKQGCWDMNTSSRCLNISDSLNCTWKNTTGWCEMGTGNGTNCWNYYDNATCSAAFCTWRLNQWCEETGPWQFTTNASCIAAGFNWSSSSGWCSEPNMMECWKYDYNQTGCQALSTTCSWNSPYCYKKSCSDYTTSTACNASAAELNCKWSTSQASTGWCEEVGCWSYWNNNNSCTNTTLHPNLDCTWQSFSWCELDCWNNTKYNNASTCNANKKCNWANNWCDRKGCWNYMNQTECLNVTDELNCTWDNTYNYCKQAVECWSYNSNQTCINAGCNWSGGACMESGCESYKDSSSCTNNNCSWKSGQSFCEEKNCWMYDSQGETNCTNSTLHPNLKCEWSNPGGAGWCQMNASSTGCYAYITVNDCKATGYCWWDAFLNICNNPDSAWINQTRDEVINPGCWIFDYQESKCRNVTDCGWSNTTSRCSGNEEGINCTLIKDSNLCSKIPVLRTCCKWTNNTCQEDTSNAKCFENLKPPPIGAAFCEDYNAYTSQQTCLQIAGDPWYMPCKWDDKNTTSDKTDDRCVFRASEKFGGGEIDFDKITNKKDCSFAGGTWSVEYYCEGNKSVPYGWCERKKGAAGMSCDASCWACEYNQTGGNWTTEAQARSACTGSKLGYCNWTTDSSAPDGKGYCKMPEGQKNMGDCSNDCKACEFKKSPKDSCQTSPANCKWVSDTTGTTTIGGWCYPQNEKSCSEDCFRCYDQSSCTNYGGGNKGNCQWDSSTKLCKPKNYDKEICFDAVDNDGDDKIDCEDSDCYSDQFCGASGLSNCWKYTTQTICSNYSSENCVWIADPWSGSSWCGRTGENCFLWDGDQAGCGNQTGICQWSTPMSGGFCRVNKTNMQTCFKLSTESDCKSNSNCQWVKDSVSGSSSCKFKPETCKDYSQTQCTNVTYCTWTTDPSLNISSCKPKCLSSGYSTQSVCNADLNCQWVSGFCNPSQQSGMNMEDCWRYENNQTGCNVAPSCQWKSETSGGFCGVNETLAMGTCKNLNQTTCISSPYNNSCLWMSDPSSSGGWCDLKLFKCGMYSYNQTACLNTTLTGSNCTWTNNRCDPICSNFTVASGLNSCLNSSGGLCSWHTGFCEPKMAMQMFAGMDSPPVPLGGDQCPEGGIAGEQDICGFGLKDDPNKFAFGITVQNMLNSALCNGQRTKINQTSNDKTTGSGTNTTKWYWYLDTDNVTTGGCTLYNNASSTGYEFFFKYITKWTDNKLQELKTSYRCEDSEWILSDIKISVYQTLMCEQIGGAMIAVEKSDLDKFPSLYKADKDIRIYAATGSATTTEINPVDVVGPAKYKKGSADFKFEDCMSTGVDMDGDGLKSENDPDCFMFQQKGFIKYEDCFETGRDEDGDGLIDCADPDCKFAPNCGGKGVNVAGYVDQSAPTLKWYEVDKFPDAAFVRYDTDEPANGTILFYYNDSSCGTLNATIKDPGLLDSDTYNDYKNWHDGPLDNFNANSQKLGYVLSNNTSYYYRIRICDSSGNCGLSACLNFTTPTSSNRKNCPSCQFTFKLEGATDFKVDLGTGTYTSLTQTTSACGGSGMNMNYTQASNANIRAEGDSSAVVFENASLIGVTGSLNITDGTTTSGGYSVGYSGIPSDVFDEIGGKMRPSICKIEIPRGTSGNCDKVWKCDDNVGNCIDVTANSTLISNTSTICIWKIQCDFSTYRTNSPTSTSQTTGTSGGGGGGGGGGGSGVTVLRATGNVNITIPSITKGKTSSISIYKTEDVAFRQINISVIDIVTKVKITYNKLGSLPTVIKVPGDVYNYIEIKSENISESSIHKIGIKFAVDKSWITTNSIDSSSIKLYRWSNNNWVALTTEKLEENDEEVSFVAESPGLSYFAISGNKPGETPTPTGAAIICTEMWSCTDWSVCTDGVQTRKCTDIHNCGTVADKPEEAKDCVMAAEVTTGALPTTYIIGAAIIVIIIIGIAAWKFKVFKVKK